jgi:hypothetical protein
MTAQALAPDGYLGDIFPTLTAAQIARITPLARVRAAEEPAPDVFVVPTGLPDEQERAFNPGAASEAPRRASAPPASASSAGVCSRRPNSALAKATQSGISTLKASMSDSERSSMERKRPSQWRSRARIEARAERGVAQELDQVRGRRGNRTPRHQKARHEIVLREVAGLAGGGNDVRPHRGRAMRTLASGSPVSSSERKGFSSMGDTVIPPSWADITAPRA